MGLRVLWLLGVPEVGPPVSTGVKRLLGRGDTAHVGRLGVHRCRHVGLDQYRWNAEQIRPDGFVDRLESRASGG